MVWCRVKLVLLAALQAAVFSSLAPALGFEGNAHYGARRLRGELGLKKAFESKAESLAAGMERLAAFYRRNGFIDARVEFFKGSEGQPAESLKILISEGPRYMVGSLAFRGNDSLEPSLLAKGLSNRTGRPYNPDAIGSDEFKLLMTYADRGYVFAGVETSVELMTDTTAALAFSISEGRRVRVGAVSVRGNSFSVGEALVRRVGIRAGDFFSRRAMLDGELALSATGLFREARVQPGAVSADSTSIEVEISVSERPRRRFETGLGYGSGDAFRVMARWLNRNVDGWGQRLELGGLAAVQLWRDIRLVRGRVQASYREPWLFRRDLPAKATVYYDENRPPYTDYRLQTVGIDLDIYQKLGIDNYLDWRASQQWLRLSPNWRDPETPSDTIRYHGRRSIFTGWYLNRLDDPLSPGRGYTSQVELEYTGGVFGGVSTFQRINTTLTGYATLAKPRTTLACRIRGGIIGDWEKKHVVPYYERFYLGGPTTLRGYSSGKAGRLSEAGAPLGGKKMVMTNIEVRPVIYRRWLASLFLDVGILSDSPLRKLSLSEAYTSPGLGLRYVLPMGTGRLDAAAPGTQVDKIKEWKVILAWGEIF